MTDAVARIKLGLADSLSLGNLDAHRDWRFAGDYVRAMWSMLQQETADDYVIATGVSALGARSCGGGLRPRRLDWRKHVRTDPKLVRPAEVERLVGDASKAQRQLAWQPTVDFKRLIAMMVDADLERLTETSKLATPAKAV